MNILIAYEESQVTCKAFRIMGHNAFSCDIQECSGGNPEWHILNDANNIFTSHKIKTQSGDNYDINKWDLIGIHPPCTKMTYAGNAIYAFGKNKYKERMECKEATIQLYLHLTSICEKVYMENPVGAMNGDPRLPSPQIIHPYYFGDPYLKRTCLWLHGLKKLIHIKESDMFTAKTHVSRYGENNENYKWYDKLFFDIKDKKLVSKLRSKSFPGIANAMAKQWGN